MEIVFEILNKSRTILQYYGKKEHKVEDDIQSIILDVLQQGKDKNIEVNDKDQSFIQEVLIRNGKQVSIVAFLTILQDFVQMMIHFLYCQ